MAGTRQLILHRDTCGGYLVNSRIPICHDAGLGLNARAHAGGSFQALRNLTLKLPLVTYM